MTSLGGGLNRRDVLRGAAGVTTLSLSGLAANAADKSLHMLSWEGYSDEIWVKRFEEEAKCEASVTYITSMDEVNAKMNAAKGTGIDIISIETSSFKRFAELGLVQPIQKDKLPNLKNLLPNFQNVSALNFDGKTFGVPFAWGSIPLVYATTAFATPPDSWSVLWDEKYKGRIIMQDDANNNIVLMAIALQFADPFNLTDDQFAQIKDRLLAVKRNVLTYYAGFDEGATIFAQGGVDLMFSMAEAHVPMIKKKGVDVEMVIPKEGAIGWIDCWAVSGGTADVDLAHAWIDFATQPDVGGYISQHYDYASTTNDAENQKLKRNYADKLKVLQAPESFAKRVQLWNEVKATPI